jgi:tetratricopeptide (TPR) repeat protein
MIPCWPVAREHVQRFGFRIRWWLQTAVLTVAAALVLVAARDGLPRWYDLAMTDAVVQPTLTREALPVDGPVYLNPSGLALARFGGALPPRHSENEASNLGREPSLWRAADRGARYRAVWLLGDKSDYAPLARHLGESPDWRLAAADATGLLFLREPRAEEFATEPVQDFAASQMTGGASRSTFLGGAALACLAANAIPEAGELSALAVRRSDLSSRAAAARALVLVSLGQPREAVAESERAIKLDPASATAWQVRAETLLHAGLADDAYAAAERAVDLAPGDAGALWLAARSANAARALQTEATLLEELIALTAARGGDAAFYHLYLGQSYARQGLARPALRSLQIAAEAPGLTAEQRRELEDEIATLRANPASR